MALRTGPKAPNIEATPQPLAVTPVTQEPGAYQGAVAAPVESVAAPRADLDPGIGFADPFLASTHGQKAVALANKGRDPKLEDHLVRTAERSGQHTARTYGDRMRATGGSARPAVRADGSPWAKGKA
jgi:hypothetical protein